MGLLDEAIREHLELKRRRGANAAEVARQEQEAFGPPRRGEFDVAPATDETAAVPAAPAAPIELPSLRPVEDPAAHEVADEEPHVQDEPPRPHGDPADALLHAEPEPELQETRAFDVEEIRAATQPERPEPPVIAEPPPVAATPPPPPPVPEPEPEVEPEPEPATAAARPDEETGEEDLLEETPEFLQETPEHDRLWFEQRPPRDFDF